MANNRLYIVDTETKEYLMLAKNLSCGWNVGNIAFYDEFMANRIEFDKTNLILGTENDDAFYKKWIENGINFNEEGNWKYF